jgi:hypothetical protein
VLTALYAATTDFARVNQYPMLRDSRYHAGFHFHPMRDIP